MNVLRSVILLLAAGVGGAAARVTMESKVTNFDRPSWQVEDDRTCGYFPPPGWASIVSSFASSCMIVVDSPDIFAMDDPGHARAFLCALPLLPPPPFAASPCSAPNLAFETPPPRLFLARAARRLRAAARRRKAGERVGAGDEIEVTFVMKTCPMKRAALEAKFWAVSDPFGNDYKHYLSLAEVVGEGSR